MTGLSTTCGQCNAVGRLEHALGKVLELNVKCPRISIVTPSYNQGEFIEATIQSVLNQGYPNLEYIVIDGGSTDGSVDIIRQYESELAYWVSEPDNGHGDAINKGFAKSTGEIMAWLNSDDMYTPWAFSTVAEIFQRHVDVEWLTGIASIWNRQGQMVSMKPVKKNRFDFLLRRYKWIQQESTFWKRSLWERSGGRVDCEFKYMIDGALWGAFFESADLYHVSSVLSGYRSHGTNRALLNMSECEREMDRVCETLRSRVDQQTIEIANALSLRRENRPSRLHRRLMRFLNRQKPISALPDLDYKVIQYEAATASWEIGSTSFTQLQ